MARPVARGGWRRGAERWPISRARRASSSSAAATTPTTSPASRCRAGSSASGPRPVRDTLPHQHDDGSAVRGDFPIDDVLAEGLRGPMSGFVVFPSPSPPGPDGAARPGERGLLTETEYSLWRGGGLRPVNSQGLEPEPADWRMTDEQAGLRHMWQLIAGKQRVIFLRVSLAERMRRSNILPL